MEDTERDDIELYEEFYSFVRLSVPCMPIICKYARFAGVNIAFEIIRYATACLKFVVEDLCSDVLPDLGYQDPGKDTLPAGAKLDYTDDVNALNAKVSKKIRKYFEKSAQLMIDNTDLAEKMQSTLNAQREVFASVGIRLGEANPIVKSLKNELKGIDDLAELSRASEIVDSDAMGFKPKDGWELAFLHAENEAKKMTSAGEITKIFLDNSKNKKKGISAETVSEKTKTGKVPTDQPKAKKSLEAPQSSAENLSQENLLKQLPAEEPIKNKKETLDLPIKSISGSDRKLDVASDLKISAQEGKAVSSSDNYDRSATFTDSGNKNVPSYDKSIGEPSALSKDVAPDVDKKEIVSADKFAEEITSSDESIEISEKQKSNFKTEEWRGFAEPSFPTSSKQSDLTPDKQNNDTKETAQPKPRAIIRRLRI